MDNNTYVSMVEQSLEIAKSGWVLGIGANTQTEQAKDGINRLACVILRHKIENFG